MVVCALSVLQAPVLALVYVSAGAVPQLVSVVTLALVAALRVDTLTVEADAVLLVALVQVDAGEAVEFEAGIALASVASLLIEAVTVVAARILGSSRRALVDVKALALFSVVLVAFFAIVGLVSCSAFFVKASNLKETRLRELSTEYFA